MPESFSPTTWLDGSGGGTPITAAQLNRIEQGVESMDDRVAALESGTLGPLIIEDWNAVDGSVWPAAWTGANGTRDIQTGSGRQVTAASASVKTTDSIPGPASGEMIVRFQWSQASVERYQYFCVRTADISNNTHVRVTDTGSAQTVSIRKIVAGTSTLLSSDVTTSITAGAWYWVRFRWTGTDYRAKIWNSTLSEPVLWTVTATDATHATGTIMLATGNGADAVARTSFLDDLRVWDFAAGAVTSVAGQTGAVVLTSADVGLGNVANLAQVQLGTITTKGDLIAGTANAAVSRVGVGANGTLLAGASAQTPGVQWQANPVPAPVDLTDGATVALDSSAGKLFRLSASGDRTLLAPTNPVDGRGIIIAHTASAAGRTLTLTTGSAGSFVFGSDITALTQTASGKTDFIGALYNTTADRWRIISYVKGF